jgi:proteic killer suppression protein
MKIIFEKEYLEELYTTGKTKSKKYRFQPEVVRKYIETVDKLRAANRIEDLFVIRSLHYEKLVGDKKDLESVRITLQYRLEFISSFSEIESITICSLLDISKHYQ